MKTPLDSFATRNGQAGQDRRTRLWFTIGKTAIAVLAVLLAASERSNLSAQQVQTDPRSLPLVTACQALGFDFASPNMEIGAGRADIALPTRTNQASLSAPGTLSQANTAYTLTADITADLTAFTITANDITLNLNGHTITYGTQDSPAQTYPNGTAGVKVTYEVSGTVIANGTIRQGNGSCQGDTSGRSCNPVQFSGGAGTAEVGGLRIDYHTPDTSGLLIGNARANIHHNTLVDSGTVVTYPGTGVPSIQNGGSTGSTIHHNRIDGARHRGIAPGDNTSVAYNEIRLNSYSVNSFGVMVYENNSLSIHHNKIYATGVHPIGIGGLTRSQNIEVYANYIETENTRFVAGTTSGSSAFRITTYEGGFADKNEIVCNYFVSKSGNSHPELQAGEKSWARTLWIGGLDADDSTTIQHNYIEANAADDTARSSAIAVVSGGVNSGLMIQNNTVVARQIMVSLADGYGGAGLGSPKFLRNRFIREGSSPTYRAIADQQNNYFDVTGTFIDNTYENGADVTDSTVTLMNYCGFTNRTEVFIGREDALGTTTADLAYTNDAATVALGSSSSPFGSCGYKVTGPISRSTPARVSRYAELPRQTVDTTYNLPTGGRTYRVRQNCAGFTNCSTDLQATINTANRGDVIELEAGATFTGSFHLPYKAGTGWLYIQTSDYANLPPPGQRVAPADAGRMPRIQGPPNISSNDATIIVDLRAHHYRLIGLEIAGSENQHALIRSRTSSVLADLPTDIVYDRLFVHSTPTSNTYYGLILDVIRGAVIDSHISEVHFILGDAKGVYVSNTPGPLKIMNNRIEGGAENVMISEGVPLIQGVIPSDIEIRNNYLFKPLTWKQDDPSFAGYRWNVKNNFEMKSGRRILFAGNLLENNWAMAQGGTSILLTVRGGPNWSPYPTVEDITIRHNLILNVESGVMTTGEDGNYPSEQEKRFQVADNFFEVRSRFFQVNTPGTSLATGGIGRPVDHYIITHNTGVHQGEGTGIMTMTSGSTVETRVPTAANVRIQDNIFSHGRYGVLGNGTAIGSNSLNTYFSNYLFANNVLYGSTSNTPSSYPSGNFHPQSQAAVGFVEAANGDYRLASSSPYVTAASDRAGPIGADMETLAALNTCVRAGTCTCTPNWQCGSWSQCVNNEQTRTCTDLNSCGSLVNRPPLSQACSSCIENWQCGEWSVCTNNQQSRTCTDQNACGTIINRPPLSQSCGQVCSPDWQCGEWSSCTYGYQTRSCTDRNQCGLELPAALTEQECDGLTPAAVTDLRAN